MTILAFADVQGFNLRSPAASIVGWGRDRNFLPAHPDPSLSPDRNAAPGAPNW
jgi:hypothetical protein